jgi:UDP-3-O-[3-hydroxymyristoyl] N-acetylglucosamine deacetylase
VYLQQRTLAQPGSCEGVGIHSGRAVTVTIKPAPPNHGIRFVRTDLQEAPSVTAHFSRVVDTSLATVIGADGCIVSTIEHLMASLSGLAIDNAVIELTGYEMPIMDGSAGPFVDLIQSCGVVEQDVPRCFFVVNAPITIQEGDRAVILQPSSEFKISCTIEYEHPLIKTQMYSLSITAETFAAEIARARTFGFLYEYENLKRFGLARGGSLDNVVVIDGDQILNDGGLRFRDEFVRHKMLDCIGDFSLLGMPLLGHVILRKSGHAFNHAFLNKFFAEKESWQTCSFESPQELVAPRQNNLPFQMASVTN